MTYKVLLCDDEQNVRDAWHEKVQAVAPSNYTISAQLGSAEVKSAIKELFARQVSVLSGGTRQRSPCVFDDAEILVLDYDLLYIDRENARHTGESLARLARAFSSAQVIVVVNQFQDAQFDLSLRGHFTSHADLNLDATLLDTPGLWTDPRWVGFRPWHWQTLYRAVDTQASREAWVNDHWGEPIVDALGMRDDDVARLTDTAFGFIAPDSTDERQLRQCTFKDFVCRPAHGRNVAALAEANPGDASRFVAARIGKWLERLVLGPQDALIDLPHLIQRFPFLLGDDVTELDAWNAAIHDEEFAKNRLLEGCLFEPSNILSRPAVWSHRFENAESIRKQRRTFDFSHVPSFVFLEDTSSFAPINQAKQFRAGHHNAFDRRFVKCLDDFTYAPQRRLTFVG